jgi:hypothetical protein
MQLQLCSVRRTGLPGHNGLVIIAGNYPSRADGVIVINAHVYAWFDGAGANVDGLAVKVGLARYFARPENRPLHTMPAAKGWKRSQCQVSGVWRVSRHGLLRSWIRRKAVDLIREGGKHMADCMWAIVPWNGSLPRTLTGWSCVAQSQLLVACCSENPLPYFTYISWS